MTGREIMRGPTQQPETHSRPSPACSVVPSAGRQQIADAPVATGHTSWAGTSLDAEWSAG